MKPKRDKTQSSSVKEIFPHCDDPAVRLAAERVVDLRLAGLGIASDAPDYSEQRKNRIVGELSQAEQSALAALKTKKIAPDSPDFQKRKLEAMVGILAAIKDGIEERLAEKRMRDRLAELARDENKIQRFATKRRTDEKQKLRTSTQEQRLALLNRLETPAERESLIDEHLADNGFEGGATRQQRSNVNDYLDDVRDWLREHGSKNAKSMGTWLTQIEKETRDLHGQLAPSPQEFDDYVIGQWFNEPLAKELADKEAILDEKDGDRHSLEGVLRMIGEAVARSANVEWMAGLETLRKVCRKDDGDKGFAAFAQILWCMIDALHTFRHPFTHEETTTFQIDPRFKNAIAQFCWTLTDPDTIAAKRLEASEHKVKVEHWRKGAVAAQAAGRKIPRAPMTKQEAEHNKWNAVLNLRQRGWEWPQIAEKLVEIGLEELNSTGSGDRFDFASEKRQRGLAIKSLADRLKVEFHRLWGGKGKARRRKP